MVKISSKDFVSVHGISSCFVSRTANHYNDVIMSAMASQITSLAIVYSTVYSGVDQRKHQSSPSLAFVRGIHRWPMNSPHKGPVTRKMFTFDDVIMDFTILLPNAVELLTTRNHWSTKLLTLCMVRLKCNFKITCLKLPWQLTVANG